MLCCIRDRKGLVCTALGYVRNLAIANRSRSAWYNILLVEYDSRNNCSQMTSIRCNNNFRHYIHVLQFWDTDSETVYSTVYLNDLQRSYSVILC